MRMIDETVIDSAVRELKRQRLFRYDCDSPEESATARLEKRFAEVVGSNYAVAMNSCSSALFTSLLCAGIQPGDEVLIPAFAFIAVPSAIVHAGAVPRLVDVTEDYVIDIDDLERKIGPRTKALMVVHMRGRCPDMHEVTEVAGRRGLVLIEDAAHALGVRFNGVQAGRFGLAGCYSAQSYKMIDGGEGGILVTDDEEVAFKAMLYAGCYEQNYRKHFWTSDADEKLAAMVNSLPAYNFRMSNLAAAVLIPQLEQIDARAEHFNSNFERLTNRLCKSDHIRVPQFPRGVTPAPDSVQWEFIGMDQNRISAVVAELAADGVRLEVFSGSNARCFWNWTFFHHQDECRYSRALLARTADMRLRLHLDAADIDELGAMILSAISSHT